MYDGVREGWIEGKLLVYEVRTNKEVVGRGRMAEKSSGGCGRLG